MRPSQQSIVCAAMLAATVVCGRMADTAGGQEQPGRSVPARLTDASRQARMPLPAGRDSSTILELRVETIENPAQTPLTLDTAFAPCAVSNTQWEPERLASLGVYPADQPGNYAIPVADALSRLRARGVDPSSVCLRVELRFPQRAAEGVAVTLAPPAWRTEK